MVYNLRRRNIRGAAPLTVGIDGRYLQDKFHGIGRYVHNLLTGLCAIDGDVKIIVFVDPALPNRRFPLDTFVRPGKIEFRDISIPLYGPQELWAWPVELLRTPVDVFHSPFFWSPLALPCPLVATVHDMILDRYPQYMPGLRYLLPYRIMSRLALRAARRVIAVSDATKRDIVRFSATDPAKIDTILCGVDTTYYRPVTVEEECARVRDRYGLPEAYVLAVGARRPHKNIHGLISAFERIKGEVSQSLVLVGTVDDRFVDRAGEGIAALKREGRMIEIAHVDEEDLPILYAMADLFVQPSIVEGFGAPVIEAMACGCPVACSNTASLPEVAGDAAVLFNPRSEAEMAEAVRGVLLSSDLRDDLRLRSVRRARQRQFTLEAVATHTLDVYRSAASTA